MKALCGAATALTCVGAVVSLAAASSAAAGPDPRVLGPSFVYDDDYSKVLTAVTVRANRRSTGVTLDASNFPPSAYGRSFGAHVHVDRCGAKPTDAGKHYQHSGKGKLRDRELWLDFTVDQSGRAHVHSERPWAIKAGAANSVVVHSKPTNPTSGKAGDPILCTTVPFHGPSSHAGAHEAYKAHEAPGYKVKSTFDMSKDVRKDIKQVPPEKYDARVDKQASPGPRAEEHHAHEHEGRHHEHEGRHHEHEGRHHEHEGRHHEHDGRDHEYRDHDGYDHGYDDRDRWYDDREYHGTRFHGHPVYRVPVYRNHSNRGDERLQPQSYGR